MAIYAHAHTYTNEGKEREGEANKNKDIFYIMNNNIMIAFNKINMNCIIPFNIHFIFQFPQLFQKKCLIAGFSVFLIWVPPKTCALHLVILLSFLM